MIVVSDTSPINYLILIEQIDRLYDLYRRVVVPPSVYRELQAPDGSLIAYTRSSTTACLSPT